MKRLFAALAILVCTAAGAATLSPIQLLNPAGSTAGQAIISTGPTSPPAWATVSVSAPTGTLPIANGGTGATTAATARTNLGAAPLASPTFTGTATAPTPATGTNTTQLATTAFVSSTLAAPPAIGSTTPAAGTFTTLSTTASAKTIAGNSSGQSISASTDTVITNWTVAANQGNAFVASTGVFTAPRSGFYQVSGSLAINSASFLAGQNITVSIKKNGATYVAGGLYFQANSVSAQIIPPISVLMQLAAGDKVTLALLPNGSSSVTLANSTVNYFTIAEIL